eukprot:CAMPEP_0201597052 /NCGR_PEP_ID=MMETSP0190_2-20130828/193625_1 /ASSEMBLY_ACC=CAM_ASM_000263 /TAXON_ID=37353 /ORGANISM="Rosalina sp." /LENGTH=313 /DNA_ID=CAMNT_0048057793 /DNA_START=583 /DNA_END=1522 /DNA_ORIENTATION=-
MNGLELIIPSSSPEPKLDKYDYERIRDDELILEQGKTEQDLKEEIDHLNAKSNAQILVMVDDIPDIDAAPPDNVLFVCRLNSITEDEDLRIIFRQYGVIKSCDIVKDWKTGDSLQYAFIEYENVKDCQKAYIKMENALIDDRRIHVDFSQSVAKYYWHHKKKGKFNGGKGGNHARVIEANRIWNKSNQHRGDNQRHKTNLKFESIGDDTELTQKFNKTKLNRDYKRDRYRDKTCRICGELGHLKRNCPNKKAKDAVVESAVNLAIINVTVQTEEKEDMIGIDIGRDQGHVLDLDQMRDMTDTIDLGDIRNQDH